MHELNGAQVSELMKIILEMRKKHPGWIAVEVPVRRWPRGFDKVLMLPHGWLYKFSF